MKSGQSGQALNLKLGSDSWRIVGRGILAQSAARPNNRKLLAGVVETGDWLLERGCWVLGSCKVI